MIDQTSEGRCGRGTEKEGRCGRGTEKEGREEREEKEEEEKEEEIEDASGASGSSGGGGMAFSILSTSLRMLEQCRHLHKESKCMFTRSHLQFGDAVWTTGGSSSSVWNFCEA
jgi:hypothetical protein